jgi:hypothetical protein
MIGRLRKTAAKPGAARAEYLARDKLAWLLVMQARLAVAGLGNGSLLAHPDVSRSLGRSR